MIAPRKFVCLHSESIRSRNRSELTSAQSVRRGKTVLLCTTVRVLEARTLSLPRRPVPCSGKFGPGKKMGFNQLQHWKNNLSTFKDGKQLVLAPFSLLLKYSHKNKTSKLKLGQDGRTEQDFRSQTWRLAGLPRAASDG